MALNGFACCICMQLVKNTDSIVSTSCGHLYHNPCLTQWRASSKLCPQCRCTYLYTHKIFMAFSEEPQKGLQKQLVESLTKIENQNSQLLRNQEELKNLTQCNEDLVKQKNDLIVQLTDVKEHNVSFNKTITYLGTQIQLKERQYMALNQNFCNDNKRLAEMQKEISDLKKHIEFQKTEFKAELSKVCSWNVEKSKKMTENDAKIKSLDNQLIILRIENEKLKNEKLSLNNQIQVQAKQLTALRCDLEMKHKIKTEKLNSATNNLDSLKLQFIKAQVDIEVFLKEKIVLNNKVKDQAEKLAAKENQTSSHKKQIIEFLQAEEKSNTKENNLKNLLSKEKSENEKLQNDKLALNKVIQHQTVKFQHQTVKFQIQEHKIKLQNEELKAEEEKLAAKEKQISSLKKEIIELQQAEEKSKEIQLKNLLSVEKTEMEKLQKEKIDLNKKIENQKITISCLTEQFQKEKLTMCDKLKCLNDELSAANEQLCELKETNGNMKNGILSIIHESAGEQTISKKRKFNDDLERQCVEAVKTIEEATMIPPSRPNVTRLSDDSVMLRWFVPKNDGLPIQFFKVQYRMLGDITRRIPRENWQTTNEEIPYGKRDRNTDGIKNYTSSVAGLLTGRFYRFRIIAVYTNNDNKEGNTSSKFFLQQGDALELLKSNLPVPELSRIEALSDSAVMLHWSLPPATSATSSVDGFYAYYRPSSSAGDYLKATVDGIQTRNFVVDMLESGTTYEFKLQSFNEMAASDFSSIVQGKTKKSPTTPAPIIPSVVPASKANPEDNSIYPVVAGAAGGGILLLIATVAACLCMKKRKNSQAEEENKPQLEHIQSDFVTPQVLGVNNHHKSNHRPNGVIPRMNITPNPLAAEADKNRNVMELRFMANNSNSSPNITNTKKNSTKPKSNVICTSSTSASATNNSSRSNSTTASNEQLNKDSELGQALPPQHQQQRSSSSCETLEAHEGITNKTMSELELDSPLDKPLPPLPSKKTATKTALGNHTTSAKGNHKNNNANTTSSNNTNLNNSQALHLASQGIHHAQPYYQTPPTPTMMNKRDYQQPPPVPPHQNNNHAAAGHHLPPTGIPQPNHYNHGHGMMSAAPLTPCLDQQRRTLDRSLRNLQYSNSSTNLPPVHAHHENGNVMNMDGLSTRIPSLRRTRRTSGGNNSNMNGNVNGGGGGGGVLSQNPNGGLGIPVTGSPRVQRSPMPARSAIMKQRSRLGSHNDNISQGSLNSIEV